MRVTRMQNASVRVTCDTFRIRSEAIESELSLSVDIDGNKWATDAQVCPIDGNRDGVRDPYPYPYPYPVRWQS